MLTLLSFNFVFLFLLLIYAYSKPQFIITWVVIFTCIWSIPVGLIWYFQGKDSLAYAFSSFVHLDVPIQGDGSVLLIVFVIFLCSITAVLGTYFADKSINSNYYPPSKFYSGNTDIKYIFIFWLAITLFIISENSVKWYYVFIPAYADGSIYVNYILRTFYIITPLVALYACFEQQNQKYMKYVFLWALIISLSTGQRRNFIVFVLFFGYLFSYFKYSEISIKKRLSFFKFNLLFFGAFSLVILLWVFRVVSTNLLSDGVIIDPFTNRSVLDVLFGSGATGLPTSYFIVEITKSETAASFYNLFYGFTQVIPRTLWDGKPVGIDSIVQQKLQLDVSPSVFWFGDYFYSFGLYISPIFSFVFSFFITLFQKIGRASKTPLGLIISALAFGNIFTLYKNGFGAFMATFSTSVIIASIIYVLFIARKQKY